MLAQAGNAIPWAGRPANAGRRVRLIRVATIPKIKNAGSGISKAPQSLGNTPTLRVASAWVEASDQPFLLCGLGAAGQADRLARQGRWAGGRARAPRAGWGGQGSVRGQGERGGAGPPPRTPPNTEAPTPIASRSAAARVRPRPEKPGSSRDAIPLKASRESENRGNRPRTFDEQVRESGPSRVDQTLAAEAPAGDLRRRRLAGGRAGVPERLPVLIPIHPRSRFFREHFAALHSGSKHMSRACNVGVGRNSPRRAEHEDERT